MILFVRSSEAGPTNIVVSALVVSRAIPPRGTGMPLKLSGVLHWASTKLVGIPWTGVNVVKFTASAEAVAGVKAPTPKSVAPTAAVRILRALAVMDSLLPMCVRIARTRHARVPLPRENTSGGARGDDVADRGVSLWVRTLVEHLMKVR